jgi:hypothetical protein
MSKQTLEPVINRNGYSRRVPISEGQLEMTTYEQFLCWIIVMLLVLVVGEASIIKLGVFQSDTAAQFDRRAPINDVAILR